MAGRTENVGSLAGRAPTPLRNFRAAPVLVEGSGVRPRVGDLPTPLLVYFLTIYLPIGFGIGSLVLTGTRIFLMLMIVPLTIRLIRGQFGRITLTDLLFFFFIFWLLIAMIANDPGRAIAHAGSTGIEFLGGYLITRAYVRTPSDFRNFCLAIAVFVLATLPLALIEMVTARPILPVLLEMIPGIHSASISPPDLRFGLDRVSAVFDHAILYGLVCATAFSLVFVSLKGVIRDGRRHLLAGVIAFCTFSSVSSAALIALGMQIALILWACALSWFPARWTLLAAIGTITYSCIGLIWELNPFDVLATNFTYNPMTAYHRTRILYWGLQSVWSYPWTGIGLNDWKRPFDLYSSSVDNFWLLIAMRYGIPAFLAVAGGYVLAILRVSLRETGGDLAFAQMRRGWVFSMITLAFVLTTVFLWGPAFSLVLSILGAGIWMIHYRSPEVEVMADMLPRRDGPSDGHPVNAQVVRGESVNRPGFTGGHLV